MVSYRSLSAINNSIVRVFKRNILTIPQKTVSLPITASKYIHPLNTIRHFSNSTQKLLQVVQGEIKHEVENYSPSTLTKDFLANSGWKFKDEEGQVDMALTKTVNGHNVTVEFQLVSPFEPDREDNTEFEMTEFTVTVEKESAPNEGLIFYCTTIQNDEKFRYMISNLRCFSNEEEKTSPVYYNGPDFEDLDDMLQSALDEWLGSLGIDSELCNFIDSCSVDKEQREYISWLKKVEKFVS